MNEIEKFIKWLYENNNIIVTRTTYGPNVWNEIDAIKTLIKQYKEEIGEWDET